MTSGPEPPWSRSTASEPLFSVPLGIIGATGVVAAGVVVAGVVVVVVVVVVDEVEPVVAPGIVEGDVPAPPDDEVVEVVFDELTASLGSLGSKTSRKNGVNE